MPRILVADDNSNIQRMVALALQGEGIEVVAVGDGEAAVRKLPDGAFDLVLADIFMPVRSGYEVCEFIKHDSRYSHIPVVLLVGAFDPLDEVEAQRVSADGILKKPFVPPDPLIGMVKGLLAKSANERLVAVAVPVAVSAGQSEIAHATSHAGKVRNSELHNAPAEEFPALGGGVSIGQNETSMDFSPLLEMPAADDADLILTAHRDPSLGEPCWDHPQKTEEAAPHEGTQEHTWSNSMPPLGSGEILPAIESAAVDHSVMEIPAVESIVAPEASPEYDGIASLEFALSDSIEAPALPYPGMELSQPGPPREQPLEKTEGALTQAPEQLLEQPFEWVTSQTVQPSPLEAASVPWWKTAATKPPAGENDEVAKQDAVSQNGAERTVAPEIHDSRVTGSDLPDSHSHQNDSFPSAEPIPAWLAPVKTFFPGSESLWASTPESLADTQEMNPSVPGHIEPTTVWPPPFEPAIAVPSPSLNPEPLDLAQPAEPEHALAQLAAEPAFAVTDPAVVVPPAELVFPESAQPDSALIEAVVMRVIERMQPKVFDVVTREILRPLVEAMVRREIDKH